ncbi:hypothetical protein LSAT2_001928 [Lamellibrachia satsuma]|nr:hypothetical protein LSAT2_001928 [Lamellibrachia satsuma]
MPLVIGRSANPRCFKSCHVTPLSITYESNNKAWMTGELFAEWMCRVDNRMRRQTRHILLFLDNCGAHPHMELENVSLFSAAKHDLEIATIGRWHHPEPEDGVPKEASAIHHLLDGRSEHSIQHSTTDNDEWGDADLLPLLPPGITFKDYVASDSKVATQTTISDDWEGELVASARAIKDGGGRDDAASSSEEDEAKDSPRNKLMLARREKDISALRKTNDCLKDVIVKQLARD